MICYSATNETVEDFTEIVLEEEIQTPEETPSEEIIETKQMKKAEEKKEKAYIALNKSDQASKTAEKKDKIAKKKKEKAKKAENKAALKRIKADRKIANAEIQTAKANRQIAIEYGNKASQANKKK